MAILQPATITLPDAPRLDDRVEFLSVLDELPDEAFGPDIVGRSTSSRWLGGVSFTTRDCDQPGVELIGCLEGQELQATVEMVPETTQGSETECLEFEAQPFMMWSAMQGATIDGENEVVGAENMRKLGDFVSYLMARELIQGTYSGQGLRTDPFLIAGAPTIAQGAVGAMEEWYGGRVGNVRGVLHVSKTTLAALYAATAITYEGNRYYTPSGHLVVADAGYREEEMNPVGTAVSGATTGWAYITGPVWWKTNLAPTLGSHWERLDRTNNILKVVDTAYGLIVYRECAVGAMLITY